jgi:hypothetical protein
MKDAGMADEDLLQAEIHQAFPLPCLGWQHPSGH